MSKHEIIYPAGHALMDLAPYAHCLKSEHKRIFCDFCFRNCKFMHYCGTVCQRHDWEIHKHECKEFKECLQGASAACLNSSLAKLFIRLQIKLMLDNGNATDEKGLKTFDSLIDHYNEIRGDMKRIQLMRVCFEAVKSIMGVEFLSKLSIQQLMSVFGKMVINSFSISNTDSSATIGSGIYLSASSLDHSCFPNCAIIFNGSRLFVRVISDMAASEKPLISYTDSIMSKQERQVFLGENYYFDCMCSRCNAKEEPADSIVDVRCEHCSKGSFQLSEYFQVECVKCGKTNSQQQSKAIKLLENLECFVSSHSLENCAQALPDNGFIEILDKAKFLLKQYDGMILSKRHVLLVKLYEIIFELSIKCSRFHDAANIGQEFILNIYRDYYPKNHPSICLLLIKTIKLLENDLENQAAKDQIFLFKEEARAIVNILYDQSHPIFEMLP